MSTDRDVTRIVQSWLEEGVNVLPDRVLDAVLDQLPATRQRRAAWLGRRFPIMNNNLVRASLVAAAVVVAVIVGANLLPKHSVGPSPSPTASSITAPAAAWSKAAMPYPGGQSVLLLDGKVLIIGSVGSGLGSEVYDPATRSAVATPRMLSEDAGSATLLEDGRVMVAYNGVLAEVYDPRSGTWTDTGSTREYRPSAFTTTRLQGGKVLIVGGVELQGQLAGVPPAAYASAELYDPASVTWTPTGSMSQARHTHTATLLPDGKVLVVGGLDNGDFGNPLASAELYDPATGAWTPTGSMNDARSSQAAVLLADGRVLVVGGSGGIAGTTPMLDSAEIYDPVTGSWTTAGTMAEPRSAPAAVLLENGKVLVAGGFNGHDALASAELYDPATGTWTSAGTMSTGRERPSTALLSDGTVLVTGGTARAVADLYDPGVGS